MRSASEAFARIIAGLHDLEVRADVLFDREVIEEGLAVNDGRVRFDRAAARLAALDCTIADPLRIPTDPTDILTPFGYELRVWRGIPGELLPLATCPIQRSSVDAVDGLTVVSALDRSQLVSDARFEDDEQIAAGTNYATAIQDLIEAGVPGLEFLFPSVSFTTPLLTFSAQDDRWEAAQKMARSIGHEILFDGLGRCVMRPEPTFETEPALIIADGSNLIDVRVALDRAPAYNRVIAFSTNASTGAQYRGVATDDDPTSPTFYDGPFGRKPRFYYSEFIASNAQATSAAAAILASGLGVAKMVDFSALPDPRLEGSDVVKITNERTGIDALHIVDSLTIELGPEGPLTGASRAQEGVVSAS